MAALWACLRRVGFINSLNSNPSEFGFVLDHLSKFTIRPLVQPLVHLATVVNSITDAANIADCNRRDTSLKEHLHDLSAQFMKEVRDLVVDVFKLLVLRLDELLPAVRSRLFAINLRVELGLEAVLVVAKGAKFSAVDRESVLTREDSSEVLFPEIDSSDFASSGSIDGFCVVLSTDDESIRHLPDLDGTGFFIDRPINQNRVLSAFRGQAKHSVISKRDSLIRPPEHVVLFVAAARRIALTVVVVPGTDRFVELLRDFLGRLRRKKIVTLAVPPTHRRLTEPVVLSVYSPPVPLADVVPQIRRGTGQPLKLLGAFNMEFAGQVHALGLIFDVLFYDRLADLSGRRDEVAPRPERRKPMQMIKLLSQNVGTRSFEPVNHLIGSVPSIRLDEQMNMIGANRQGIDFPVVLFSYIVEHFFQAICDCVFENRSPPLWAPHEVVLHRVNSVAASPVWFFVDWHRSINRASPVVFRREYSF